MKYSMVKQFSNASVDNAFKFVFKIIDFGKILLDVFWGIFDIFAAFYLIFFNIFMYFYYLLLFILDRGSESSGPASYKVRRASGSYRSKIPKLKLTSSANPIPAMYRVKEVAAESISKAAEITADTAQSVTESIKPKGGGHKKGFIKPVLEFIVDILITIKSILFKPFAIIAEFFSGRLKPVRENDSAGGSPKGSTSPQRSSGTSLIDEYMKEYKKGKK